MMAVKQDPKTNGEKLQMDGEEMEEVDRFLYMGVIICTDGGMEEDVTHRLL